MATTIDTNLKKVEKFNKLHSAEYFVESRNYWWNLDFLQLMANRWQLQNVMNVLDVGCGVSHWGMLLKNFLPENAKVFGIDKEQGWIEEAEKKAKINKLEDRYFYKQGDGHNIPFADQTFDMVTCQTVLIHVKDVRRVLSEMLRVLKSGGIILLIEPNNIACSLSLSSLDLEEDIEEIFDVARFQFLCERGKMKLNEGYFSIGDQLPGYLSEFELENIQVFILDKARPLFPPYSSKEQKIIINEREDFLRTEFWIWNKDTAKRYYQAGGGEMSKFEYYWNRVLLRHHKKVLEGINHNLYSTSGGRLIYSISATKR